MTRGHSRNAALAWWRFSFVLLSVAIAGAVGERAAGLLVVTCGAAIAWRGAHAIHVLFYRIRLEDCAACWIMEWEDWP